MNLIQIGVLAFSGFGAGVITGLIGASAVVFIAGILVAVLGYPVYLSIGIGLVTDVFTSAVSTYHYRKNGNIDLRKGLLIGILAVVFAFAGSFFSRHIPDLILGDGLGIVTLIAGLNFLMNPKAREEKKIFSYFKGRPVFTSILVGSVVGLISGIFGVGGGLTILFIFFFVFNFPIKKAVGTSVLIMAFISFAGGIGHFISYRIPWWDIVIASIAGMIGSMITSKYANKMPEEKMLRITGIILILISFAVIFQKFITIL